MSYSIRVEGTIPYDATFEVDAMSLEEAAKKVKGFLEGGESVRLNYVIHLNRVGNSTIVSARFDGGGQLIVVPIELAKI